MAQLVSSLPPVPAYPAAHLLLSAPGALRPAGFGRLGASIHALQAGPAGDVSQKPDDGAASSPAARAGRETPQEGADRVRHVLKAEAARPDATAREATSTGSPGVGPMGAGQPADAGPTTDVTVFITEQRREVDEQFAASLRAAMDFGDDEDSLARGAELMADSTQLFMTTYRRCR